MPYHGDTYGMGGQYNHNNDSSNGRHYNYNGAAQPDSPSSYSQLTTATRYNEEEDDPDAPVIIRVIAPATLPEGYTIDVLYNDEPHTVDIPRGGVQEGEEFETVIDPKRVYKYHQNSVRRMQMEQLEEVDDDNEEAYSRNTAADKGAGGRFSRDSGRQQEEPQRQSQAASKLYSANLYDSRRQSEYSEDTRDTDIEKMHKSPTQSLSEDEDYDEAEEEKTHIQNQIKDTENAEKEEKTQDVVWYDENGTPNGGWRTRLLSCCDVLTQSTFWMGLFCTPILMAQLITRLKLTWNGRQGPPEESSLSYNRIVLGLVLTMGLLWVPALGSLCLFAYYLVVTVYVGSHVRGYMRQKYQVPSTLPTRCGDRVDDICMMLFCGCCSSIQMARHTHDDKDYPGHACTTTGLEFDAPEIV